MGRVPNIRRILSESFPDLEWMPRLASNINIFMEQTIRLFDKNLTFGDNFDGEVKQLTADGQYPIKLAWGRPNKPVAVWVAGALRTNGDDVSYSAALYLKWRFNEAGQIQIDDILGLDDANDKKYTITIIGVSG